MSNYRRLYVQGGCYFFTLVTWQRKPLLLDNIVRLRAAFRYTMDKKPFTLQAIVVLPDHLHCLWRLPDEDDDFSGRWHLLKRYFSIGVEARVNQRGEKQVWQQRFWEHAIRDEQDWENHFHYIHFNPVKHAYVTLAYDWQFSSFQKYVNLGWYAKNWGDWHPPPQALKNLNSPVGRIKRSVSDFGIKRSVSDFGIKRSVSDFGYFGASTGHLSLKISHTETQRLNLIPRIQQCHAAAVEIFYIAGNDA